MSNLKGHTTGGVTEKLEASQEDDLELSYFPSYNTRMPKVLQTPVLRTTLSSKGQLVLPKAVREASQWQAGDELSVFFVDGQVRLQKIEPVRKNGSIDEVAGCLKRLGEKPLSEAQLRQRMLKRFREQQ